jgi:hypothetical protein
MPPESWQHWNKWRSPRPATREPGKNLGVRLSAAEYRQLQAWAAEEGVPVYRLHLHILREALAARSPNP